MVHYVCCAPAVRLKSGSRSRPLYVSNKMSASFFFYIVGQKKLHPLYTLINFVKSRSISIIFGAQIPQWIYNKTNDKIIHLIYTRWKIIHLHPQIIRGSKVNVIPLYNIEYYIACQKLWILFHIYLSYIRFSRVHFYETQCSIKNPIQRITVLYNTVAPRGDMKRSTLAIITSLASKPDEPRVDYIHQRTKPTTSRTFSRAILRSRVG